MVVLTAAAAAGIGSCGDDDPVEPTLAATAATEPAGSALPSDPSTTIDSLASSSSLAPPTGHAPSVGSTLPNGDDPRVEAARADLVERFGHDPADIVFVRIEGVTWPTSALGCPSHEATYAATPVPGYRIVMRWQDVQYQYHGAQGDDVPFLCQFLD